MRDLGLVAQRPAAHRGASRGRQSRCTALSRQDWQFAPVIAQPTLASAIQIGNPVSVHKAIARCSAAAARGAGERTGARRCRGPRRSHGHVRVPAHRRGARGADQAGGARRNQARRAGGRHFDRERIEVHRVQERPITPPRSRGLPRTQANRPIELPNDYDQIRRHLDVAIPA